MIFAAHFRDAVVADGYSWVIGCCYFTLTIDRLTAQVHQAFYANFFRGVHDLCGAPVISLLKVMGILVCVRCFYFRRQMDDDIDAFHVFTQAS